MYSDEYGVESQCDTVYDDLSGIKDEPGCNEGTCTLDDTEAQQPFDSVGYVQHAEEIQSSSHMFGIVDYKQETVDGATDHQVYNNKMHNLLNTHVQNSSGDIRHYEQASDQSHNIDEQELAADNCQHQSSVYVKDVVKGSTHAHMQNVYDDPDLPVPAFLNHTNLEEGSVIITKCRMVCESLLNCASDVGSMTHFNPQYETCSYSRSTDLCSF